MAEKVLLIFRDNWADEMDVTGFKVMTKKAWEKYKASLDFEDWECYFGTNESINYASPADYLRCIAVKDLTDAEAKMMRKLFLHVESYGFGHFPEHESEEDESEEDEG